jgi:nucleoside-diphosphate-sugar epimerase
LVTGGTGFIGHHLVAALRTGGQPVTCLVRPTSKVEALQGMGVSLVVGDLAQPETLAEAVAGHSTVYHLAGLLAAFRAEAFYQVNVGGTAALLEACAGQRNPPVVVIVSSLAAAGPSSEDHPRREEDPPAPVSHYGRSKLAAERAANSFARQVPISVVRPPIVFGEGDRDVLRMFRMVQRGWHLVPGRRPRRYSLIHAADLAQGLLLAAERGERMNGDPGDHARGRGVYFLAGQLHPTYAELGPLMAEALGRRPPRVMRVPMAAAWLVALTMEILARLRGQPDIFNLDKMREAAAGSWTCSSEKAVRQLGFEAPADLASRLRQTATWYLRQGWL